VGQASVITLHPFDDDEALAWLGERLDDRIEMSLGDLSRQFGWKPSKLRRRLATWAKAGHFTQASGSRGKVILAPAKGGAGAALSQSDGLMTRQAAAQLVVRAFGSAGTPPVVPSIQKPARSIITLLTAIVLFATSLGLTAVGLVMNARFAASFGQNTEASVLLAAIGLAVDLLAVVLPTVAAQLWQRRMIVPAGAAWLIWLAALSMTLLAATGFASTNIGDAVAGRAKIAGEAGALTERIGQLRRDRAGVTETRSASAIEVELQRAQPEAQAVWKITNGCRDVTRVTSARVCANVMQLREALAAAEHRDAIDAELRQAQSRLSSLPPIAVADPQATTVSEIITWVSAGTFNPAPGDIARLRALGLALTPSLAGIVCMLALSLAQARRV
jgi:hypothetical protein